MLKKYTIRDIAELAGVSKGTVDRVLHNRGKVSEIALMKVNAVLDEIDFKPNPIAKNLKSNKVYHICVLLPDQEQDPYWNPCITGINDVENELDAFGVSIETFFFNPVNTKSFLDANALIQSKSPDAVLLVPLFLKEALIVLEGYNKLGITVSTFNNKIDSQFIKSFIGQDLFQSGRVAAKLMHSIMQKGNIAVVHIDEKYKNAIHMQQKENGFRRFFKETQGFTGDIISCKIKHPNFESSLIKFLEENKNIAGIFVTTSKIHQVAKVIQELNLPHLTLIGYDLLNENVDYLKSGVIDFLIHQNPKQQAYIGLKHLVEHFLFEKNIPDQILLPIDIINSENVKLFMRN
ncbi:LacI family DNA-binding transcriptional regulator [Mariniflexile sp. HMF6888]|uniref:LacI family DNA-binding transcriptional regulator n=1 Tax=Mariniflexile sp. HMF6888 TaxID=3373086 RepID=UPI0037950E05